MNKEKINEKQTIEEIELGLESVLEQHQYKSTTEETIAYAKESLSKIINTISINENIPPQIVLIGIAEILQSGGHIRGVLARKAYIGNWDITKKHLITTMNTVRCNCTLRAIARANNKLIAKISKKRKIYGNLYPQYKTFNPEIIQKDENTQLEHAVYCVDFQKDNNDAPAEVLKFLNQREIEKKSKRKKS